MEKLYLSTRLHEIIHCLYRGYDSAGESDDSDDEADLTSGQFLTHLYHIQIALQNKDNCVNCKGLPYDKSFMATPKVDTNSK